MVGGLEPEEELRLARLANDGLAEIVQRYPHRFLGVATLPFSSPAEALREFDRCVDSLGFKGLQISSNVNGTLLDAPELFPIYERAAQRGLPVWIHPTTPVMLDLVGTKGNADLLFGWPMDTSLALFRLVIGGVLEKLPQLKVIVHHLGAGMVPYFIERLDGLLPAGQGELPITRPPSHYWKSISHDTAAVDANAFACGFNVFGPDHNSCISHERVCSILASLRLIAYTALPIETLIFTTGHFFSSKWRYGKRQESVNLHSKMYQEV